MNFFKVNRPSIGQILIVFFVVGIVATFNFVNNSPNVVEKTSQSFIISGQNAINKINAIGVQVTHELKLIDAFAANLTSLQKSLLTKQGLTLFPNSKIKSDDHAFGDRLTYTPASATNMTDADLLHNYGLLGDGVTIVFLDSGVSSVRGIRRSAYGRHRVLGTYNSIDNSVSVTGNDASGHGSHVASVAINSEKDSNGRYYGIAPNARIISVHAFDEIGEGSYADVILGIQWSIYFKNEYNIRVLNMSFSSEPLSMYWDDPLNQAVMKAWKAGIVVVSSAGNRGQSPGGIGVPSNVPYIITVGAVTDNYTPDDFSDDRLASFSSAGPTYERFVKPEIVAPGGHLMGLMKPYTRLAIEHPEFHDGGLYFTMSGTSQSAAVVSGIVALIIGLEPGLTPDDVKCRLMSTAKPARNREGQWA